MGVLDCFVATGSELQRTQVTMEALPLPAEHVHER